MPSMFNGPPKPPALPTATPPDNPQLDATAKANAAKQGAAATVLTQPSGKAASVFGD